MGGVESVVGGGENLFGVWIVKKLSVGLGVVADQNAFEGLGAEGGAFTSVDAFHVRCAEEGDEFAVVWK